MMPKKDGFTLAKEIRAIDKHVPIIFLTARGKMEDRILGFKTGCDDYITKPFSSEELNLRIQAIIRRCENSGYNDMEVIRIGSYLFNPRNLELCQGNRTLALTLKEAALLKVLHRHRNQLITRQQAMKEVWGSESYFVGRSMDVFISRLRKYFKDDPDVSITNVHGMGFKFKVIS
jgi:DNA-binding response OmpR family regulator